MDWSHRCFYWLQQPYDRQHASTRLNLSSFPFHQPSSRKSFRVSYPPTVLPTFRRNKTNDPSNKHPLGEHKRKFLLISNTSLEIERELKKVSFLSENNSAKNFYSIPQSATKFPIFISRPIFSFRIFRLKRNIYIYIFFTSTFDSSKKFLHTQISQLTTLNLQSFYTKQNYRYLYTSKRNWLLTNVAFLSTKNIAE